MEQVQCNAKEELVKLLRENTNAEVTKGQAQITSCLNYLNKKGFVEESGMVLNPQFLEEPKIMKVIGLILSAPEEELGEQIYILTDEKNRQYISKIPGTLGGHNKLKIYGKIDCSSALSYLKKGQYAAHRVFFKDEETAVKAGYRPCGKCMPEKYKTWRSQSEGRN